MIWKKLFGEYLRAAFNWSSGVSGDWNTASAWTPATVPNDPLADVTIDAPTPLSYVVTIAPGESETVHSLTMNGANNLLGSNTAPYNAAQLAIDGSLTFAPGSPGDLGGSLQSYITMTNGTIVNPGTIDGFVQAQGNVLLTGTNGLYITNWLQSLAGTVIIDTKSIAELTGNVLFDGIFDSQGANAAIYLGGPRQNLVVNIGTIGGPPLIPEGWTELLLNGPTTNILEFNGTTYAPLESTLTTIANRATLDVLGGRNYASSQALTVATGGMLNLQAGTVQNGGIDINGGTIQGAGSIVNGVTNNGTLSPLGTGLVIGGPLTGTGTVQFGVDHKTNTPSAVGTALEVHAVGAGQILAMTGRDVLTLDAPAQFAGTISAKAGDTLILKGVNANAAVLTGSTLQLQANGAAQLNLPLSGSYAGDVFTVSALPGATQVKITAAAPAPTGASAAGDDTQSVIVSGDQHANVTTSSLNITASGPSSFISAGSGDDISSIAGSTVVDAGASSNFLASSGSGNTAFSISAADATDTVSTIAGFHAGDSATIRGVDLTDFTETPQDNAGAAGSTGLGISFSAPGHATTELVLAGYTSADLTNGRLAMTSGEASGTPYVTIQAA
ncbi:MAG: hypothetical protein ACJ8AI_24120 [Rhodopila sp.]